MRSLLLLATLLVACGSEQNKPADPAPAANEPALATEPKTSAIDAGVDTEDSVPTPDSCVSECVASRQMQATSPEQIEADCQARCATPTPDLQSE